MYLSAVHHPLFLPDNICCVSCGGRNPVQPHLHVNWLVTHFYLSKPTPESFGQNRPTCISTRLGRGCNDTDFSGRLRYPHTTGRACGRAQCLVMPTKTTRIRRGVLVGKKDRIVIEQWSCDVCRAGFDDYHDAVRHERTCRMERGRPTNTADAGSPTKSKAFHTAATRSDSFLSISSTTNVNNNHSAGGDNQEARDPSDSIPRVIHVTIQQPSFMMQETRDDANTVTLSTLRHDLRLQMASNRNAIEEYSHMRHTVPIRTQPTALADADYEVLAPAHSGHQERVARSLHETAFRGTVTPRLAPRHLAELVPRSPSTSAYELNEAIDRHGGQPIPTREVAAFSYHELNEAMDRHRRQPIPTREVVAHTYPIIRRNNAISTNEDAPEHQTFPPAKATIKDSLDGWPSHINTFEAGGEDEGIVADSRVLQHLKEPQYCQLTGDQRIPSKRNHENLIQPPAPQMKWLCDCCRKIQFESYVDAFRHELQCRKQMYLAQQQKELETLAHSEPEKDLRLSANRREWRREQLKRQVYEKSRSLCSTIGDRNPTTISSISGSFGGAVGRAKSVSSSGGTKWLCSICKEICFDHYLDACRHEKECARLRIGQQHYPLLQQVDE